MVENITGLLARVLKGSFKFETIFPEGKILDSSSADQLSTFYFLEKIYSFSSSGKVVNIQNYIIINLF